MKIFNSLAVSCLLCTFPVFTSGDGSSQTGVSILSASSIITTIAGTGETTSSDDGTSATDASLLSPFSVAFDKKGNVYIAEYGADRIRKIDAITGYIETFAGTGTAGAGANDIAAVDSDLSGPTGMAFDSAGNMYIADCNNHKIRKVDANMGTISTIAGTGESGFTGDGGFAIYALLNSPVSMVVDKSFNMFIADTGNNCIRRVSGATGYIKTYADGSTSDTQFGGFDPFFRPSFVAMDASQNIYIADEANHCIHKVDTATAKVVAVAGVCGNKGFSGDGGLATRAKMTFASSIAIDSLGNIYIADKGNYRVRMVDASSKIMSTVAGTGVAGYNGNNIPALTAAISPLGIAIDKFGNIFIAEKDTGRIRSVLLNPPTSSAPSASPSSPLLSSAPAAIIFSTASTSPSAGGSSLPSSPPSASSSSPIVILPSTTSSSPSSPPSAAPSAPTIILPSMSRTSSTPSQSPLLIVIAAPSSSSPSSPTVVLPSTTSSSPSSPPSAAPSAYSSSTPTAGLSTPSASPSVRGSSSPSLFYAPDSPPTRGNVTYSNNTSPSSRASLRPIDTSIASSSPSSPPSTSSFSSPTSPPSTSPLSLSPTVSSSKLTGNAAATSDAGYTSRSNDHFTRNLILSVAVSLVVQYYVL